MPNMQKTMIIGHVGKDPGTFEGGKKCTYFSVAVSEKWGTGEAGGEHTEWFRCKTFGPLAEVCAKYLKKGSAVYVEGKLRTESYEKDGEARTSTELIANTVQFLSPKREIGFAAPGNNQEKSPNMGSAIDKQYELKVDPNMSRDDLDIPF